MNNNNYLDFADMQAFEKYLASEKSFGLDVRVFESLNYETLGFFKDHNLCRQR